jgi:hypothetical protein
LEDNFDADEFNIRKPASNPPSSSQQSRSQQQAFSKIKISLFEMNSGSLQEFQFTPSDILSHDELK